MATFCLSSPKDEADIPFRYRNDKPILRVGVVEWLPFIEVNETETALTICGPMARLLKDFSETFNFNFTLNLPRKETGRVPGDIDEFNNATGVLGMIINDEADISGVPITAKSEYYNEVRFTDAIINDQYHILSLREEEEQDFFSYLLAFDIYVWTLILLSMISLGITSYLMKYLGQERKKYTKGCRVSIEAPIEMDDQNARSRRVSIFCPPPSRVPLRIPPKLVEVMESIGRYHRMSLNQSVPDPPKRLVSRVLFIIWWFTAMSIIGCFAGNLLHNLLKNTPIKAALETLEDVYDRPSVHLLAVRGTVIDDDQYAREDVQFVSSEAITSNEYVDLVIKGTHAMVINKLSTDAIIQQRGSCHFHVGSYVYTPSSLALVTNKNKISAAFHREINLRIRNLMATGVISRWLELPPPNEDECLQKEIASKERPLSGEDIEGVIVILLIGLALSVVSILVEIFIQKNPELYIKPVVRKIKKKRKLLWKSIRQDMKYVGNGIASTWRSKRHELRIRALSKANITSDFVMNSGQFPLQYNRDRRMTISDARDLNKFRETVMTPRSPTLKVIPSCNVSIRSESIDSISDDSFDDAVPRSATFRTNSRNIKRERSQSLAVHFRK